MIMDGIVKSSYDAILIGNLSNLYCSNDENALHCSQLCKAG